jgi:hypothetical protein
MPPSKIFESWRGCSGRGHAPPSENLNQLSECPQSESKRDESELLTSALFPSLFGDAPKSVLQVGTGREFLQIAPKCERGGACSAVSLPCPNPTYPFSALVLAAKSGILPDY